MLSAMGPRYGRLAYHRKGKWRQTKRNMKKPCHLTDELIILIKRKADMCLACTQYPTAKDHDRGHQEVRADTCRSSVMLDGQTTVGIIKREGCAKSQKTPFVVMSRSVLSTEMLLRILFTCLVSKQVSS